MHDPPRKLPLHIYNGFACPSELQEVAIPPNTHQYPPIPCQCPLKSSTNTLPIPSSFAAMYSLSTHLAGFVLHERPPIRCSTIFSSFPSLLFLFLCSYCSASSSIRLLSCFAWCTRRGKNLERLDCVMTAVTKPLKRTAIQKADGSTVCYCS